METGTECNGTDANGNRENPCAGKHRGKVFWEDFGRSSPSGTGGANPGNSKEVSSFITQNSSLRTQHFFHTKHFPKTGQAGLCAGTSHH